FGSIVASVLPIVAVIGLVAGAVYTLKYAFDHNIGGIQTLVLQAAHLIELAWNALVQLFTDGGFSGSVLEELEAGHQGIESFAIQVYVWANRIIEFFSGIAEGFKDALDDLGPEFDEFVGTIHEIADAIGGLTVDTEANGDAFASWGRAGARIGLAFANIVGTVLDVVNAALEVTQGFVETWSDFGP